MSIEQINKAVVPDWTIPVPNWVVHALENPRDRIPMESFTQYVKCVPLSSAEYQRLNFGPELP